MGTKSLGKPPLGTISLGKLPLGTKDGRREQQFEVSVLELKTEIRKLEGQLQAHKHQNRGLMSLLSEEREKYSKIENFEATE